MLIVINPVQVVKTIKVVNNVPQDILGMLLLLALNFAFQYVIIVNFIMEAHV